jgi:predicted nucleic acid-binding protein
MDETKISITDDKPAAKSHAGSLTPSALQEQEPCGSAAVPAPITEFPSPMVTRKRRGTRKNSETRAARCKGNLAIMRKKAPLDLRCLTRIDEMNSEEIRNLASEIGSMDCSAVEIKQEVILERASALRAANRLAAIDALLIALLNNGAKNAPGGLFSVQLRTIVEIE